MHRKHIDDLEGYEGTHKLGGNVDTNGHYDPDVSLEDDPRQEKWKEQQSIYGFDSRQTWSLRSTMIELLYERLIMFMEVSTVVDKTCHIFDVREVGLVNGFGDPVEEMNQEEIIQLLITLCKSWLLDEDESFEISTKIWKLWTIVHPAMWW